MRKKKPIRIEFAELRGEFRIIKKILYIILAALISLLIKIFWDSISKAPTIIGNVIKRIFS